MQMISKKTLSKILKELARDERLRNEVRNLLETQDLQDDEIYLKKELDNTVKSWYTSNKMRKQTITKNRRFTMDLNEMTFKPKTLTVADIKKLQKKGKVTKCPMRSAKYSKNRRWGQAE